MAERNPVIPAKPEPTSTGKDVVSWPNRVEEIPEPVGLHAVEVIPEPVSLDNSQPASDPVARTREAVEEGVAAVKRSLRTAESKSKQTTATIVDRVRVMAVEQPVQFLAAVAGIAFVAGVVLRIWRSSYE
ncbi:MAG TPA: hypothetical protein VFA90_17975 [Terriglobales bacterium]|nr:hypothetical protein [Terriglobales bacterium]